MGLSFRLGDFADATPAAAAYVGPMTSRTNTREKHAREPGKGHRPGPLIALLIVPLVFATTVLTFAWPSARLEPRDLPLGVAGPSSATAPIVRQLERDENAFDLHFYATESEARSAIEDRNVYGAIVASGGSPTLLTSSAASPLVAGMLENAYTTVTQAGRPAPRIEDVVPADSDDPRGSVLSSLVLPLVLSSVIAAVIVSLLGKPGGAQAGALLTATALAALVGIAMVQGWLGAFSGDWLVNAGVLFLMMVAIGSVIAGCVALMGTPGIAVGALTMILIGNPWSAVSTAPELLPQPIGLIGQLLPPGAGGTLLRSTAFYDDAGAAMPLTVLVVWSVLGLSAIWAGAYLQRRREAAGDELPERAVPTPS